MSLGAKCTRELLRLALCSVRYPDGPRSEALNFSLSSRLAPLELTTGTKVTDREEWRQWLERVGEKIVGEPSIDEALQYQVRAVSDKRKLHALGRAIEAAIFELDQDSIDAELLAIQLGSCPELDAVLRVRARIDSVTANLLDLLIQVRRRLGIEPANY